MLILEVALYALRTKFTHVERKILPWFESYYSIIFYLELNPALLAAETAMGFDEPIGLTDRSPAFRRGAA
jgi:hypothetical protein